MIKVLGITKSDDIPKLEQLKELMRERIASNKELFEDTLLKLVTPGSNVSLNNSLEYLLSTSRHGHCSTIPPCYFDRMDDKGVLYVTDYQTGKEIRKDESILTDDLVFTHKKFGVTPSKQLIDVVKKTCPKLSVVSDEDKGKTRTGSQLFVFSISSEKWVKADKSTGTASGAPNVTFKPFNVFKSSIFRKMMSDRGISNVGSVPIHLIGVFDEVLLEFLSSRKTDADIESLINCGAFVAEDKSASGKKINYGIFEGIHLHSSFRNTTTCSLRTTGDVTTSTNPDPHMTERSSVDTAAFLGYNTFIQLSERKPLTANIDTRNSVGDLLNYSDKIEQFKVGFRKRTDSVLDKTENSIIYMGFELEMCSSDSRPEFIRDIASTPLKDYAIMKSDGSLDSSRGLEFVSVPATLDYHKAMMKEYFFDSGLADRARSTDSCGLHVHIGKKHFSYLSLAKLTSFICSKNHKDFIDSIAGRSPNSYCSRLNLAKRNVAGKSVETCSKEISNVDLPCLGMNGLADKIKSKRTSEGWGRGAVNVSPRNTVELRLFKSSVDENSFMRKLEFCDSLVRYCRQVSVVENDIKHYVDFIIENKKTYPYMIKFLASKNMVGHDIQHVKGTDKVVHVYAENLVKSN